MPEEELAKAIGRNGQNVRLTNRLMGWDVQVDKDASDHEKFELKVKGAVAALSKQLEIDPELAQTLVEGGLPTLEAVAMQADGNDLADLLHTSAGRRAQRCTRKRWINLVPALAPNTNALVSMSAEPTLHARKTQKPRPQIRRFCRSRQEDGPPCLK